MTKGVVREGRTAWFFLLPSLLLYGIYVMFPVFHSFYLSLTDWDGVSANPLPINITSPGVPLWANYAELWQDEVFWTSLKNNCIWLVAFSIAPFVGLAMALFFHVQGWMATVFKTLVYVPMVFSLVVVGLIWGWFLQPDFGLVEYIMHGVGILKPDEHFTMMASFRWSTAGLVLAATWPHAAYCMVLYLAGLSTLQKNVIEAASIDGVNRWQMLRHVILPMLRPTTAIVMIVTMIGALRTFELVAIMTDGGPANSSNVLANYMYQQTFQNFRYGYGAAIAVTLFLISLGLIVLYLKQTQSSD